MKIFSLKKYDNFVMSRFESRKVRYFFLKLPIRFIKSILAVMILIALATRAISIGFILTVVGVVYLMSFKGKKNIQI
ncbi:MAG: hypothetical protein ACRCWG_05135 [Sarcina sp.]